MGLTPSPEDLARALDDAGELTFVRWRHLQRNQGVATFIWKGRHVQFSCAITEVLEAEVPERPLNRGTQAAAKRGTLAHLARQSIGYSEEQLRARDLPLYLSDEWLRAAFERLGSQRAISRTYGYSNQVISRSLIRIGIETLPRVDDHLKNQARTLKTQGLSLLAIAEQLNISKATVSRACRGTEKR